MLCRPTELSFPLNDACNEDLIKKNKKRKPLGAINLRLTMSPVSKEEMNEVRTGESLRRPKFHVDDDLIYDRTLQLLTKVDPTTISDYEG